MNVCDQKMTYNSFYKQVMCIQLNRKSYERNLIVASFFSFGLGPKVKVRCMFVMQYFLPKDKGQERVSVGVIELGERRHPLRRSASSSI